MKSKTALVEFACFIDPFPHFLMCQCIQKYFRNEYAFGAAVLRIAFGLLFVLVAIKKFRMGFTGYADALIAGDSTIIREFPHDLLYMYGLLLPSAEFVAGTLLLVNQWTREAYATIAIIYLSFVFGQMYDGNTVKVGVEYMPSLIALVLAVFMGERAQKTKR